MADEHPKIRLRKDTGPTWAPVIIIIALAILVAVFWFTPRPAAIKGAERPPATGPANADLRVDITNFQPAPAPSGDAQNVSVEGQFSNVGGSDISGVNLRGTFRDSSGKVVLQQEQTATALQSGGKASEKQSTTFADQPIAPGANAAFRAIFTEVPPSWNKQKPEITVLGVQMAPAQPSGRPNPADIKR
jgi:hypothetical protein